MLGISSSHGLHQVAQKLRKTTLPLNSDSASCRLSGVATWNSLASWAGLGFEQGQGRHRIATRASAPASSRRLGSSRVTAMRRVTRAVYNAPSEASPRARAAPPGGRCGRVLTSRARGGPAPRPIPADRVRGTSGIHGDHAHRRRPDRCLRRGRAVRGPRRRSASSSTPAPSIPAGRSPSSTPRVARSRRPRRAPASARRGDAPRRASARGAPLQEDRLHPAGPRRPPSSTRSSRRRDVRRRSSVPPFPGSAARWCTASSAWTAQPAHESPIGRIPRIRAPTSDVARHRPTRGDPPRLAPALGRVRGGADDLARALGGARRPHHRGRRRDRRPTSTRSPTAARACPELVLAGSAGLARAVASTHRRTRRRPRAAARGTRLAHRGRAACIRRRAPSSDAPRGGRRCGRRDWTGGRDPDIRPLVERDRERASRVHRHERRDVASDPRRARQDAPLGCASPGDASPRACAAGPRRRHRRRDRHRASPRRSAPTGSS